MIKFGLFIYQNPARGNYVKLKEIAETCERYGFESIWLNDHLFPVPTPTKDPFLECWTTLTALAVETKKLRMGTLVLCNSFRPPSIVAKMGATLDFISEGRLEFGIGAGNRKDDYDAYGIPFSSLDIRIQQLEEGVQIIKKMWTEESPSFNGKFYTIKDAVNEPKPVQKPHPPILIGTGKGGKAMLKVIAKFANIWNLSGSPAPQEYREKLGTLREYCVKIGRDPAEIENSITQFVCIAEDKTDLAEKIKTIPNNRNYLMSRAIVGTPEQCVKRIEAYVDVGVRNFMISMPDIADQKSLQLIGEQVIPIFRDS